MTLQGTTMTLQEQARQSGLVLLNETAGEWNTNDWPPLEGGWRHYHASVVIHHPHEADDNNNHKGQTVVVMGGCRQGSRCVNSVLVLNLEDPDKQWREGSPMNKKRLQHAAVVCNGAVYVMGGCNDFVGFDCMERIDCNDLSAHESHWTTLTCRLSTLRVGCCAVAVHNRYIVVMGGVNVHYLSSVDIIDTRNHTVTERPSMNVPRHLCASAVIGHRIFVVGGRSNSVEYLEFAVPCETKKATGSTFISFSTAWITYSDLVLSNAPTCRAMVAVGSCLVVAGGGILTVEVLDTSRNRLWNLPPFGNHRYNYSMVTAANQVAVIGGWGDPTCATLPLLDKNSWCFRRLCEQQPSGWYHSFEKVGFRDADLSPSSTSTSARKRARSDAHRGDKGNEKA